MGGRVYDPKLGRFLSVDPLLGDLGQPQSLNTYSYVMNNPLAYTDPSGFASIPVLPKPPTGGRYDGTVGIILKETFPPGSDYKGLPRAEWLIIGGRGTTEQVGQMVDVNIGAYETGVNNYANAWLSEAYSHLPAQPALVPDSATPESPVPQGPQPDDTAADDTGQHTPITGWGPIRPPEHRVYGGRDGSIVEPGGSVSLFIEDKVFAGHTFGVNHDKLVAYLTGTVGLPDPLANVPTMWAVYHYSVFQESINLTIYSINRTFGSDFPVPFRHTDP